MGAGFERSALQLEVHRVGLGERLGYDSIVLAAGASASSRRVPARRHPTAGKPQYLPPCLYSPVT